MLRKNGRTTGFICASMDTVKTASSEVLKAVFIHATSPKCCFLLLFPPKAPFICSSQPTYGVTGALVWFCSENVGLQSSVG